MKLLEDVFVEADAVHQEPEDEQGSEQDVHTDLLAFTLHSAVAVGANPVADLSTCCKHNSPWSAHSDFAMIYQLQADSTTTGLQCTEQCIRKAALLAWQSLGWPCLEPKW